MARKPHIVTADWTSRFNGTSLLVRSRAEVDGPTGVVDIHVLPEGGFPLMARFDVRRVIDRKSGAPRGWDLTDRAGNDHHERDLTRVLWHAAAWVLDDAREVLKGR